MYWGCDDNSFYLFAMELFHDAGHADTLTPVFSNHSSAQLVFFDSKQAISFSKLQRELLSFFSNISFLFSYNGCSFFSIVLQTEKKNRSQVAHDIHSLIHPSIGALGTVCLFKYDNEVMLSFVGYGLKCMLSDWYSINDYDDRLLDKLHIANTSITRGRDYFYDMIYSLAREYYFAPKDPTIYELIPINLFSERQRDEIDREELNQYVKAELLKYIDQYGDDYLEYDSSKQVQNTTIGAELDMMLLEMDDNQSEMEEIFEEIEDDSSDGYQHDEYEFDGIDPEIFKDPTLMIKFLEKSSTKSDKKPDTKSSMARQERQMFLDDYLFEVLEKADIRYIDNREKGGALWVVGGHELDDIMADFDAQGYRFFFSEKGGKATSYLPSWYLPRQK